MRVLSFGAGVQSSALLLLCDRGDLAPVDFAVFADTGAEPAEVYAWLDKISRAVKTPIHIVKKGDIVAETIAHWRGERKRCGQAPFHALDNLNNKGMLRRHCTKEYKIEAVDREIRKQMGLKRGERVKDHVELLMGISFDEQERMRIAQDKWKTNIYPLVEMEWRRGRCIDYVKASGLGTPPRSACYFCPYKTDAEWRHLRYTSPADWQKAIEFDEAIRTSVREQLSSEFFVHRDCVPLAEADLNDDSLRQMFFLDECEGMCGT